MAYERKGYTAAHTVHFPERPNTYRVQAVERTCEACGTSFSDEYQTGRERQYCPGCAAKIARERTRERVKAHRAAQKRKAS